MGESTIEPKTPEELIRGGPRMGKKGRKKEGKQRNVNGDHKSFKTGVCTKRGRPKTGREEGNIKKGTGYKGRWT